MTAGTKVLEPSITPFCYSVDKVPTPRVRSGFEQALTFETEQVAVNRLPVELPSQCQPYAIRGKKTTCAREDFQDFAFGHCGESLGSYHTLAAYCLRKRELF